jgi:indoleamine 2,3-dioxygenase
MQQQYTDGFFNVSPQFGFLPCKDPLAKLPVQYLALQNIIDALPKLILDQALLDKAVAELPVYDPSNETDSFIIQALFRAYAFLSSAYLLTPAYHSQKDGNYGKALNILPKNLAKPFVCVADKLQVMPWLEYHYAYSLGNYIKVDPTAGLFWKNLKMACSFTGGADETGFIMDHVYINEKTPDLIKAIYMFLGSQELQGIQLFYETLIEMNKRRKTMWQASDHRHYNDFRIFIMGIKGNDAIFGPGVQYKTGDERSDEYRQYRGQTGAQDDIIPTADIFTGIDAFYPHNELTAYLLDLRQYRPKCVQNFLQDLQVAMQNKPIVDYFLQHDINGLVYLLAAVEQVYLFRNGHWQFVQKYIMANTRYSQATGGTPVISWLPNQIEACLQTMSVLIQKIQPLCTALNSVTSVMFQDIKNAFPKKVKLLDAQHAELQKINYDFKRVYDLNIVNDLQDN